MYFRSHFVHIQQRGGGGGGGGGGSASETNLLKKALWNISTKSDKFGTKFAKIQSFCHPKIADGPGRKSAQKNMVVDSLVNTPVRSYYAYSYFMDIPSFSSKWYVFL